MNPTNCRKSRATSAVAILVITFGFGTSPDAATWYVDSAATGARNGTSWANAWTALTQIAGAAAGDTVYISGGPSGSNRNYSVAVGGWTPSGGSSASRITYQIGQDAISNGTATFICSAGLVSGASNIVISGDAGDAAMRFKLQQSGGESAFIFTGQTNVRLSYINGGQDTRTWFYANDGGCSGFEIDHCYFYNLTHFEDDVFLYFLTYRLWYHKCNSHHKEFHFPPPPEPKP